MTKTKKTQGAVSVDNDVDERMVPAKHKGSGIYGEHMARYEAATNIVKGKRVLDIASGSGYGAALLAKQAKSVVGVDVSADAVKYSKKVYGADNITFKKSNGKTIPFDDNEFDVVVSFETIEHLDDYHQFMAEIKRVLKDDGVFVLSTPNELEFAEGNHFHLHEFENDELAALVKEYYKYMTPFYQATWVGNLVGTKEDMTSEWEKKTLVQQLEPIAEEKFLYFYFLCSNRPIKETVETRFTISQHSSDRSVHEKHTLTQDHIENLEEIIKGYKQEHKKIRQVLEHYENDVAIRGVIRGKRLVNRIKEIIRK